MKKQENKEIDAQDLQVYEVGFHVVPTVSENDLGARVTAIRDVIEGAGGKMITDEYPKHIELAYPMVKVSSNKRSVYHSAYFGWMKFEAEPKEAKNIDVALKNDEYILRFILIKTVRENTMVAKKILLQKKDVDEEESLSEHVEEKKVLTAEELDKTIEELVIK